MGNDTWYNLSQGCKMSKSLKNFITIQEALNKNSSCQLRLFFLLHSWKDTLDYSHATMEEAIHYEKLLKEFFLNAKDVQRSATPGVQKCTVNEDELDATFRQTQNQIDAALCDNIDTKTALDCVKNLISACNKYVARLKQSTNRTLIKNIAEYVTGLFQMFGAIEGKQALGFPSESTGVANGSNVEDIQMPLLQVLAEFRGAVRQDARQRQATEILERCDALRDDILPNLGNYNYMLIVLTHFLRTYS